MGAAAIREIARDMSFVKLGKSGADTGERLSQDT